MKITLTPEQMAWINAHVACGDFPSAEEAVRQLIDERITERSIENDDLFWAKPLVDKAIAEAERGDVMSVDEHKARNRCTSRRDPRLMARIVTASAAADVYAIQSDPTKAAAGTVGVPSAAFFA